MQGSFYKTIFFIKTRNSDLIGLVFDKKIWFKNSTTGFFEGCRQRCQVTRDSRGVCRHAFADMQGVGGLSIDTSCLKISRSF